MICADCDCLDKTVDSDGKIVYRCFGVKNPFVISSISQKCTEYSDDFWKGINRIDWSNKPKSVTVEFDEKKKYVWHYNSKGQLCCENCGFKPTYSLNKDNSIYCPHCGVKLTHDIYAKKTK